MGLVISLCDYTGNMVRPWLEAGHDCIIVDIKHPEGKSCEGFNFAKPKQGRLVKIGSRVEDLRNSISPSRLRFAIGFAFPPCTHVAVSGAKHFQHKGLEALIEALTTLKDCLRIIEHCRAWCLENPVSTFSTYWRKPDFIFDPYQYASASDNFAEEMYTKRTCLWTGGDFVMPPARDMFIDNPHKIHYLGKAGQEERSITPLGFAYAVYEANKHLLNV